MSHRNSLQIILLLATAMSFIGVDPVLASEDFRAADMQQSPGAIAAKFGFDLDGTQCVVMLDGRGTCNADGRRWRFRLPVGTGQVQTLYAAPGSKPVLVYSVADDESGWAVVVGLSRGKREPEWRHHVRGLNLDVPIISERMIIVGASEYVASISAADGSLLWRHEWQYDGSGRTVPELQVRESKVILSMLNSADKADARASCFLLKTGAATNCP